MIINVRSLWETLEHMSVSLTGFVFSPPNLFAKVSELYITLQVFPSQSLMLFSGIAPISPQFLLSLPLYAQSSVFQYYFSPLILPLELLCSSPCFY